MAASTSCQQVLDAGEVVVADEGFVGQIFGGHPLVLGVPSHDRGVAEGDVVDVEQHLDAPSASAPLRPPASAN